MKCLVTDCINNIEPECAIVEITKKVPIDKNHCSYYRDNKNKQNTKTNINKNKEIK